MLQELFDVPYSVAQHSVLLSRCAPTIPEARQALMHDATEAYLGDLTSPLKRLLPAYMAIEKRWALTIAGVFGYDPQPSPWLKEADGWLILNSERKELLGPPPAPWLVPEGNLGIPIYPWEPDEAEGNFWRAFRTLFPELNP